MSNGKDVVVARRGEEIVGIMVCYRSLTVSSTGYVRRH